MGRNGGLREEIRKGHWPLANGPQMTAVPLELVVPLKLVPLELTAVIKAPTTAQGG